MKDERAYQKLVEGNHKLIYSFMNKYHLSDDWYGELAVGLCQAARAYDASRGIKLSVLAYRAMKNMMLIRFRTENKLVKAGSLDAMIQDESGDEFSFFVPDHLDRIEAENEIAYFDWIIERAPLYKLDIIYRRLQGQNDGEISEAYGKTRAWVSQQLVRIKQKWKNGRRIYGAEDGVDEEARAALREKISECLKKRLGAQ